MKLTTIANQLTICGAILSALWAAPTFGRNLSPEQSKALIRETFENVFEDMAMDEPGYAKYFSKDYIQQVDGKTLDYPAFVKHLQALKRAMKSIKVTFRYLVAEEDKVATLHIVDGEKVNGAKIKAQVNAIFQIQDGKIVRCEELTHFLEGEAADRDLGSRE